jgi:hypothetical protein
MNAGAKPVEVVPPPDHCRRPEGDRAAKYGAAQTGLTLPRPHGSAIVSSEGRAGALPACLPNCLPNCHNSEHAAAAGVGFFPERAPRAWSLLRCHSQRAGAPDVILAPHAQAAQRHTQQEAASTFA